MLWIFVLALPFLLCLPGATANAEDPESLPSIQSSFASCVATLDASPHFAPLATHGFLSPPSSYTQAQLADPAYATPAEAQLVADFQAAESRCEVARRIDLMNVDMSLSDLASQDRQLTDVNELLLIDGKESWGEFSATRAQIELAARH